MMKYAYPIYWEEPVETNWPGAPNPMCMGGMDHISHRPGDRAMQILKERYAGGEITKEQFDQMKQDLIS
jgi:hypothetical protein